MSDTRPVIELEDVSKTFEIFRTPRARVRSLLGLPVHRRHREEFVAVSGVSFSVRPGERVGLVGRNGAGKSTILKMVAGLLRPSTGSINVNGNVRALLELGTGFHPEFTGRQNVFASLAYQGVSGREAQRAFEDVLNFSELEGFIDRPLKTYSAGMYARLAFATATAVRPEVLIVDEILGAGDAYFAQKSSQRMIDLTSDGTTVLFVSHDISAVQMMCDRAIWIDRGELVMDELPHEISKAYSASIRRQAEIRLRAENLRILRGQAELLGGRGADEAMIWRLIADGDGTPKEKVPIYQIDAAIDGVVVDPLIVGGTRDNDQGERLHLLTAVEFMNWGPAKMDPDGRAFREFGDFGGTYLHAPFVVMNESGLKPSTRVTVHHGPVPKGARILLQQHSDDGYQTLGVIDAGPAGSVTSESISNEQVAEAIVEDALLNEDARYGSQPGAITAVRFVGECGDSQFVFESSGVLRTQIEWCYVDKIPRAAVFVVCLYGLDGRCAAQVWSDPIYSCPVAGSIEAVFDPLRVGPNDYLISVGVFDGLSDANPDADDLVCVLDRAFRVRVVRPIEHRVDRGETLQDVSWGPVEAANG